MADCDPGWLGDDPAELIEADPVGGPRVALRRARWSDRDELVAAVNESLAHLGPWMPWAQQPATADSIGAFLDQADHNWRTRHEFQFAIRRPDRDPDRIVGCCGLHDRVGSGALEIGYWVRVGETGRGVGTTAAAALSHSALSLEGVDRVVIRCDAGNIPSAGIPRRLGYQLDRVEVRSPAAPGETERQMVWILDRPGPPSVAIRT